MNETANEKAKIIMAMIITATTIVALTANIMKGDDKNCIEVGCDEYLAKPIDRRELLKTIGKYLPSKKPALTDMPDSDKS